MEELLMKELEEISNENHNINSRLGNLDITVEEEFVEMMFLTYRVVEMKKRVEEMKNRVEEIRMKRIRETLEYSNN